jgi:hypothetical protein
MMAEPFVYFGIASRSHFVHATHSALRRTYRDLPFPYEEDIEPAGGLVLARNQIAGRFLAHPRATHLMLVDDDVGGFTAADIVRMVGAEEDVIGGPLPSRQVDMRTLLAAIRRGVPEDKLHCYLSPALMNFLPDGRVPRRGPLCEVAFVSTGFLLVSRAALERMVSELPHAIATVHGRSVTTVFDFAVNELGEWVGEDVGFCVRWRALGGHVYADAKTSLVHFGQQAFFSEPLEVQIARMSPGRPLPEPDRATQAPPPADSPR